jgi:hypothetical protein
LERHDFHRLVRCTRDRFAIDLAGKGIEAWHRKGEGAAADPRLDGRPTRGKRVPLAWRSNGRSTQRAREQLSDSAVFNPCEINKIN